MMTPQMEQAFKKANESAEAYALITSDVQHAKDVLEISKQYKSDPAYIAQLERHIATLEA